MQTIPVNNATRNTPNLVPHHLAPQVDPLPVSLVSPGPGSLPATGKELPLAAHPQIDPYAELDAMLIRNPNTGAVHGLRTALLFNAGLILSGMMVWELWSLLIAS